MLEHHNFLSPLIPVPCHKKNDKDGIIINALMGCDKKRGVHVVFQAFYFYTLRLGPLYARGQGSGVRGWRVFGGTIWGWFEFKWRMVGSRSTGNVG